MSSAELKSNAATKDDGRVVSCPPGERYSVKSHNRVVPILITFVTVALAALLVWATWGAYMSAAWTRDGQVRAYVVTLASEVAGQIVEMPVADNQFVHKGDLLMTIDPTNYRIAVSQSEAAVQQAQVNAQNLEAEAKRRQQLSTLSTSVEEKQTYESNAVGAQASYLQAASSLEQARVNLKRTRIRSPVDGYVTNLLTQLGDYAAVGQKTIALVDANSFWIDGYFEETSLEQIHDGDPATVKLMGYSQLVHGHVGGVARGITVLNAQPDQTGLASVNPIFTWVRLAQRVPVHILIDQVPDGVRLVAGITATVQIDPQHATMSAASEMQSAHKRDNVGSSVSKPTK
jgi:multidrug resistance efflux pump